MARLCRSERSSSAALARGYGQRDGSLPQTLHVSQERLRSLLSLTRQTVNALLQGLEREQLVGGGGTIHVRFSLASQGACL